ncbi:uncharacterized protein [Dermacentor andersoni]|uniref:uncharacterized protein n=1 Tax=Dermacentor andersoni TaxID=34620 RepID=UPI003B3B1334
MKRKQMEKKLVLTNFHLKKAEEEIPKRTATGLDEVPARLIDELVPKTWGNSAKNAKPTQPESCRKPPFVGSCRPVGKPWYYDAASKRCQQISIGLCSAGNNRFLSPEKCKTVCESLAKNIPEMCLKPPVTVPCGQVRHAWYFDLNSTSCKMLSYTDPACDSAGNRFLSEMKCQAVCLPIVKPKPICSSDPEPDMCLVRRKQWFFDFRNNACMRFKKGCGKGANSFATYEKCMSRCSYNQVAAACPTCGQSLQNEQPLVGIPGVPSQVGPPRQPAQPSIPVQPGQPSRPGSSLPNQLGQSGLPPQSAGSSVPGKPSSVAAPGHASSTWPPSTPAPSGQPSRPNIGLPNQPGQSGLPPQGAGSSVPGQPSPAGAPGSASSTFTPSMSAQSGPSSRPDMGLSNQPGRSGQPPQSAGSGLPGQASSAGAPGQASSILPLNKQAQSGQSSRPDAGLPGQQGTLSQSRGTGQPVQPAMSSKPAQASPIFPPSKPGLSGPPTGLGVGQQGHAGAPLLPGSTSRPVQSGRSALPLRPGYGRR